MLFRSGHASSCDADSVGIGMAVCYQNLPLPGAMKDFDRAVRRWAGQHDASQFDLLRLLRRYGAPDRVGALIDAVHSEPGLLNACADNSVVHPLGFEQLLLSSTSAYQLRVHVWRAREKRGVEDVHGHRFSFASVVLAGSLYVSSFVPSEQGVIKRQLMCEPGQSYVMRDAGQVRVEESGSVMLTTGGAYYSSVDTFHRVGAGSGEFVATLFMKLVSERETAAVLIDPGADRAETIERRKFSVAEYSERLASARQEVALASS